MKQTTNFFKHIMLVVGFILLGITSSAQVININNAADPEALFSVEELIRNVLINGNCAEVSNIKTNIIGVANQDPGDRGVKSYGYFNFRQVFFGQLGITKKFVAIYSVLTMFEKDRS